jgi:hypothetical protein
MKIEIGLLQPNHSEYMRLVATLEDEKSAQKVYSEFVQHLGQLFSRSDQFTCAAFGRNFKTRKEFLVWKKKEWDPVADKDCKLTVEKRDGHIYVSGDYGLVIDDWSREETSVALEGTTLAVTTYTAGYGMDHLENWLRERGATSQVIVQGEEYAYRSIDDALAELQAQAGKKRPRGVRVQDGHHCPAGSNRDG